MAQQFMAPYADTLKQLQSKGAGLKGEPLRTTFFLNFGGPHCGKAQQQAQQQQASAQDSSARGHGLFRGIAANAVGGGLSGLFHHNVNIPSSTVGGAVTANAANQAADAASTQAGNAAGNAVGNAGAGANPSQTNAAPTVPAPQLTPGMVRMMSFTTEVIAIDTSSIEPGAFELPGDYQVVAPKPPQQSSGPVCPTGGQ
jgi:hypothetical protein